MKYIGELREFKNTCIAFGTFDSVHRGHLKVAQTLAREAARRNLTSVIVSFRKEGEVLTTEREKEFLFQDTGAEIFVSAENEGDTTDETVKEILAGTLGAKALVVGESHRDLEAVRAAASSCGIEVITVKNVEDEEGLITTERVREAFDALDYEKVADLCGHPYIMMGEVVHGKALGRTVGMPTANVGVPNNKLKPDSGVYATLGHVAGGTWKSLTNIGKRPSVDNNDHITIEAFLLNFKQDIYGKPFRLEVHKFIRGVQKFNNLEEVQQQVQKDLQKVKSFLDFLAK